MGKPHENSLFDGKDWHDIGENIRIMRNNNAWTQQQLADLVDIDYKVISRHENGQAMTLETLVKYSTAFNCSVDRLIPVKYRNGELTGLSSDILDCLRSISALPIVQQDAIAQAIQAIMMAMKLAA